jgi:hypothetical protein
MLRGIAQTARPFADHLVVGSAVTRAANDRGKWISVFVKPQTREPKGMPQLSFASSTHFEMHNHREDGLQIITYGVASTIGLKIAPRSLNFLEPSLKSPLQTCVFQVRA